jgi:hypothetical protein
MDGNSQTGWNGKRGLGVLDILAYGAKDIKTVACAHPVKRP